MHLLCDYPLDCFLINFEISKFLIRFPTFEILYLDDILLTQCQLWYIRNHTSILLFRLKPTMHLLCDYPWDYFLENFEISNFFIRFSTFEILYFDGILLTHANFGTSETILPFIRSIHPRTFFLIFEIWNFLNRFWTFEIQDLNDILLTHANFGTYEIILPFIRSA